MKAAICENVNLYLEKNETEFAPFLNDFAMAVWGLLLKARRWRMRACSHAVAPDSHRHAQVGLEPSKDALATEGIRFLTTIVSGVHSALFQARA